MDNDKSVKKRAIIDFIVYFIIKVKNDDIFALGAQLAYYLILSFFPFLIFLMSLVGASRLNSNEIIEGLKAIIPDNAYILIENIVREVVEKQYTGLLGASIIITIWSASSGVRAVIKGVNKAYNIKDNRSFIKRIIIAIFFTFALAIIIILTLSMLVFGEVIGSYLETILPLGMLIQVIWNFSRYLIVISMMVLVFACIYRYTPAKKIKWKKVLPGAVISTLGWIGVSYIFSYYINNIANYSRLYGSLGAVFVLITWLYITSIILIFGAEINSVLEISRDKSEN